ncbi:M56 family metallopeptidase [Paludisphaera soli]|uniref:M56 family metallopeptidase n=1 Tax=Paludisphaera soli TaxID=2712865 RepID=UPI0013E9CE0F|nr:M56 family metallopeptidase [Paludisphaera soli]
MTTFLAGFERVATAWADVAWSVAWQSLVVAAAFAAIAAGLRRASPALRCWLWRIAAIKLLLMPLWGAAWLAAPSPPRPPTARPPEAAAAPGDVEAATGYMLRPPAKGREAGGPDDAAPPFARRALSWRSALLAAWVLGVLAGVARLAAQGRRLARVLGRATAATDAHLLGLAAEAAGRLGLRRAPVVVEVDAASPFVCGLRSPTLAIPRGLADALDDAPIRAVLVHELAHLKRRDLLWDWIPAVAEVVFTVHPAARYVAYRALLERELACDRIAMDAAGQDAAAYASTLVEVVSLSSPRRPAIPAASAASPNLQEQPPCRTDSVPGVRP